MRFKFLVIFVYLIQYIVFLLFNTKQDVLFMFIMPIITLILYIGFKKKIINNFNLTNKEFYLNYVLIWTLLNLFTFFIVGYSAEKLNLPSSCGGGFICFEYLEYLIIPIWFEVCMIVTIILELLFMGIKKLLIKYYNNSTKELKIKAFNIVLKIASIICILLLALFIVVGITEKISSDRNIKILKENAEIVLKYKGHVYNANEYILYIDLDNLILTKTYKDEQVHNPPIYNVIPIALNQIEKQYFGDLNGYEGMNEIYSNNGYNCYQMKHYGTYDILFITKSENTNYIVEYEFY